MLTTSRVGKQHEEQKPVMPFALYESRRFIIPLMATTFIVLTGVIRLAVSAYTSPVFLLAPFGMLGIAYIANLQRN